MGMCEKLIELLCHTTCESEVAGEPGSCPDRKFGRCGEVERLDYCAIQNIADHLLSHGVTIQNWIPVTERLPVNFVSVLGYMIDAGEFPPVRECYTVGNAFFFPALGDIHPVSHWAEMPKPPKEVDNA